MGHMVLIPAGKFQMGSLDADPTDYDHPVHTVYTDAFYMDVHEVTNAAYNALRRNPIGGHNSITELVEHHMDVGIERVSRDGSRDVDPDDILTERVLRGGGWDDDESTLRINFRTNLPPVNTESYLGFRCVKEIVS